MTNPYTQPNHKTIQNESAPPDRAYIRRRRIFSILSLAVVLAFFTWVTIAVGKPLVELASDPEQFRVWVDQYGIWGRFILIGIMTLQVVVAMIPGEIIEIGAGYAFGAIEGTLLCLAGAAVGSAIIFLLTRCFGIKLVEAFVSREKLSRIKFLRNEKKLNLMIFIAFFIPGTPKDLLTYFIGLTPISCAPSCSFPPLPASPPSSPPPSAATRWACRTIRLPSSSLWSPQPSVGWACSSITAS